MSLIKTLGNNPNGIPPYAGARPNIFDGTRSLYNWKPSNTRKLRAGIAKSTNEAASTGRFVAIGDSETAGKTTPATTAQTSSWPSQLRTALLASGLADGGTGTVYPGTGVNDTQWTLTSMSANSLFMSWSATGQSATFTSSRNGTVATVYYFNNSGTFTVAIDGGTAVTVTPTGAQSTGTYQVTGLSNATHSIVITSTSGVGYIIGASVDQPSGLQVTCAGLAGSKTTDWIATAFSSPLTIATGTAGGTPDAYFVALGVNDANVTSLGTYRSQLATIVSGLQATSDVVLISMMPPTQNSVTTQIWQSYVAAMYDVADSMDVPLIDVSNIFGTTSNASSLGLTSSDSVPHPNAAGYGVISRAIRAVVVS